jgi:hypothetical protein
MTRKKEEIPGSQNTIQLDVNVVTTKLSHHPANTIHCGKNTTTFEQWFSL